MASESSEAARTVRALVGGVVGLDVLAMLAPHLRLSVVGLFPLLLVCALVLNGIGWARWVLLGLTGLSAAANAIVVIGSSTGLTWKAWSVGFGLAMIGMNIGLLRGSANDWFSRPVPTADDRGA